MFPQSWNCNEYISNSPASIITIATLDSKLKLFGVQHCCPLILGLLPSPAVAPPFPALTPQVGAAMHAGYVEDGDAFQRRAAEVQDDTITLREKERGEVMEEGRVRKRGGGKEREKERER